MNARSQPFDPVAARKRQLGQIHQAKKALGLDDRAYRALLVRITADEHGIGGLDSSAHMTVDQRNAVLAEFARLGFKAERAADRAVAFLGRPKNVKDVPMLGKIEALLADAKRPWSYAHKLAKKMFHVTRCEWLVPTDMHKLVAALQTDANRRTKVKAKP